MKIASPGSDGAPAFDGRGAEFLDFDQHVHLWMCPTKTELAARVPLLAPHMRPAPRQVCPAEGGGVLDHHDGVARILDVLRSYLPTEAADAIHQRATRFANYRRPDRSVNEYMAEYDRLRR